MFQALLQILFLCVYVGITTAQAEPITNVDYMPDYGLFEASRIACPVLPQYHPKQLMELLNSGKIRWVKAILAHLVRYVILCHEWNDVSPVGVYKWSFFCSDVFLVPMQ